MGCSSSLAKAISFVASIVYFLLILLQIPLFRLPCRCGICTSPIQVTCSQLAAYKILPVHAAKSLLYPGDVAYVLFMRRSFSRYYGGLVQKCDMIGSLGATINYDIVQLEIMVGSYLCVSGALLGLPKRGRVSLVGMLLLWWGLARRTTTPNGVKIYAVPMLFALLTAFLCVRRDVKRILRSFRARYSKSRAKRSSKPKHM